MISGEIQKVVEAGDTALLVNRWVLDGTGPDGSAVQMRGVSADMMRRQADGSWRVLVDDPWARPVA
jgi:ketosteroid isomerase-like protein